MLPPRAYVFIGLNIVRILSMIVLILVFSSSILVLVHDVTAVNSFMSEVRASGSSAQDLLQNCDYIDNSTVPNQTAGIFWAIINRLFIMFQVIMLFFSEICWPAAFFERFFSCVEFSVWPRPSWCLPMLHWRCRSLAPCRRLHSRLRLFPFLPWLPKYPAWTSFWLFGSVQAIPH